MKSSGGMDVGATELAGSEELLIGSSHARTCDRAFGLGSASAVITGSRVWITVCNSYHWPSADSAGDG